MMYMPKHIRIGKTPQFSFYFVTLRSKATPCSHFLKYKQTLWVCFVGAANFCVCLLKALDRSVGYALRTFYKHPSKICWRRMDKNYEFGPLHAP